MSEDHGTERGIGAQAFDAHDYLNRRSEIIHSLPDDGWMGIIKKGAEKLYNHAVEYGNLFLLTPEQSPQCKATMDMLDLIDSSFERATTDGKFEANDFIPALTLKTIEKIVQLEESDRNNKEKYLDIFLQEAEPVVDPLKEAYNQTTEWKKWDEVLEGRRAHKRY